MKVTESYDLIHANMAFLEALGVTTVSYSLKDKKWKIYYTKARDTTKKTYYYYGNNTSRVEGDTLEACMEKLNKILADEVKVRATQLQKEADEARRKAQLLQEQALALEANAEILAEKAKTLE